jgi:C1A family cysteine protease
MIYSALLVITGFVGVSSSLTVTTGLESYTFEKYIAEFKHNYNGKELGIRKAIFEKELADVIAHNSRKHSWKRGINKFSAMTEQEKPSTFGLNKAVDRSHVPKYQKALPSNFKLKDVSELPLSVDWRSKTNVVSAVKDQGHCGSCWACN